MTTIPTTTTPIHLPDELPEYSIIDAKLRKLAKAGYIILNEEQDTK